MASRRALMLLPAAVIYVIFISGSLAQSDDQNTWADMVRKSGGSCADRYASLIEGAFFSSDATCRAEVKKALETFVKADCPSTRPGSKVWQCMSGWNGSAAEPARIDAWTSFLRGCELLYIAQRINAGESEDGFMFRDNSCFQRFNSMPDFASYLRNATTATATTAAPPSLSPPTASSPPMATSAGAPAPAPQGAPDDQYSWADMLRSANGEQCADRYSILIEESFLAEDQVCLAEVKKALVTFVKADCPDTRPGSKVWQCMSGRNETARVNSWIAFLGSCKILYIDQRIIAGEDAGGIVWKDNSCFPRFTDILDFYRYLTTAAPVSPQTAGGVATRRRPPTRKSPTRKPPPRNPPPKRWWLTKKNKN